jgi:hypothetical protein
MEVHGYTKVKIIGEKFHAIIGIRKIVISFKDDVIEKNVFYVLSVSNNLLFLGSLIDKGFQVIFDAQKMFTFGCKHTKRNQGHHNQSTFQGLHFTP